MKALLSKRKYKQFYYNRCKIKYKASRIENLCLLNPCLSETLMNH